MTRTGIHIILATLILEGAACAALICILLRRGHKAHAAQLAALLGLLSLLIVVGVPNALQAGQR